MLIDTLKPGVETSEFRLTKIGIAIGLALQVLAVTLDVIPDLFPAASWLPKIMIVGGTILQAATLFGYQISRGLAKSGKGMPAAAVTFTSAGIVEELKNKLE